MRIINHTTVALLASTLLATSPLWAQEEAAEATDHADQPAH